MRALKRVFWLANPTLIKLNEAFLIFSGANSHMPHFWAFFTPLQVFLASSPAIQVPSKEYQTMFKQQDKQ